MEPGDGYGGGGRLSLPGLTGGLRLDDLVDTEPDADPTPAVAHFRSTMASMGYAVTLRLDSATSPTSPDDDGRRPFSPLVTPTPQTAALRRAPFGPAARPRSQLGSGHGRGGGGDAGGGAAAAGDSDARALSSPVSASTPGGCYGRVPPLACSSFSPPSPPPSAMAARLSSVAVRSAAMAAPSASAMAATAVVLSGGGGCWASSPGGVPAVPTSVPSPLPPLPPRLPPLRGGLGDAAPALATPVALSPAPSRPLAR